MREPAAAPQAGVSVRPARPGDGPEVVALLATAELPRAGLDDATLWVAREHDTLVGVAGLEVWPPVGLLRSVAVAPARRGRGVAAALVKQAVAHARQLGLTTLYALTDTAPGYFERAGFTRRERADVPAALLASTQLRGACPASAVLLALELDGDAPA